MRESPAPSYARRKEQLEIVGVGTSKKSRCLIGSCFLLRQFGLALNLTIVLLPCGGRACIEHEGGAGTHRAGNVDSSHPPPGYIKCKALEKRGGRWLRSTFLPPPRSRSERSRAEPNGHPFFPKRQQTASPGRRKEDCGAGSISPCWHTHPVGQQCQPPAGFWPSSSWFSSISSLPETLVSFAYYFAKSPVISRCIINSNNATRGGSEYASPPDGQNSVMGKYLLQPLP